MPEDNELGDIPEVSELPTVEEGQEDTTDWKAIALERQGQLKEIRGIAKRYRTRLEKQQTPAPESSKTTSQPAAEKIDKTGFDLTEKTFLKVNGVEHEDDQKWLFQEMKDTNKPLDTLLGFKYVQEHLKEQKDFRMTDAAQPKGNGRGGTPSSDSVEYWVAKVDAGLSVSEIPSIDMQRKVVNARIQRESKQNMFTPGKVIIK